MSFKIIEQAKPRLNRSELAVPEVTLHYLKRQQKVT